jgi:hypothetical protein
MVEIDPIDDANEPDTERSASRVRTEDVAKEANSLCRVQLGRAYFLFPAAHRDRRAAGSAQIAHPLDLAPGGPDPTPASYLNDRQRRGAGQAAVPAANGDEPIGTHRYANDQKELQDWLKNRTRRGTRVRCVLATPSSRSLMCVAPLQARVVGVNLHRQAALGTLPIAEGDSRREPHPHIWVGEGNGSFCRGHLTAPSVPWQTSPR